MNIKIIIKISLVLLFLGCLFKMPYNYFEIVRFLGMVGFGVLGYKAYLKGDENFTVIWIASALLINPFFKIALGRTLWNIIDVIWVVIIFYSFFVEKVKD